jgi:hypothetical protein
VKKIELTAPQFAFVLATRVALAFGVGLLVSDKLPDDKRKVVARSLIALGALTTIPAALTVFGHRRGDDAEDATLPEGPVVA